MQNNITELCALLWAMHTSESENNPDLSSELTELHKLVLKKTQADVILDKINSILEAHSFLESHYVDCKQAIDQQKDNDWLLQALTSVEVNVARNLPPSRKTPIEIDRDKGNEIDNIAVEIADHLIGRDSLDSEEKSNALKVIESLKAYLNL